MEFAFARHSIALLDQGACDLGAECPAMPRKVVAVGVGHEGALTRRRRIQPQVELRQVKTVGVADSDGMAHGKESHRSTDQYSRMVAISQHESDCGYEAKRIRTARHVGGGSDRRVQLTDC